MRNVSRVIAPIAALAVGCSGRAHAPPQPSTPTVADRVVEAQARRYGEVTYVALVDGDRAAMSRRGSQLENMLGSLHPAGMHEESFAGRAPRSGEGGALTLVFLDPPFAGAEVTVGGDAASPTLALGAGQMSYVFTRAPARR